MVQSHDVPEVPAGRQRLKCPNLLDESTQKFFYIGVAGAHASRGVGAVTGVRPPGLTPSRRRTAEINLRSLSVRPRGTGG